MSAYPLTGNCNIDQLGQATPSGSASARAGGDTIDTNGFAFTIDEDTRYGTGGAGLSFGNMLINTSKGGSINIDGRYVRLIPFNTGSGNVPAAGTVISQGGVTGKLIGVWTAINVAPTAAGAAMPASGWIKVKQVSQIPGYSAGALTGIGASATGADVAGWIEVVGDESATMTVPRLGTLNVTGDWFEVGTTTGSNATTYQLPTSGSSHWFPGVFVETGAGTGVFEPYSCVGTWSGANTIGTDAVRGKLCWITTAGVLQFGSDGTNAIGYVPPSGRRIVIPNIILANCGTGARTSNAVPSSSFSTRYDFTTTGGGVINIDKAMMSWYASFSRPTGVNISNSLINDQVYLYYPGSPVSLNKVAIGLTTTLATTCLSAPGIPYGGTFTDCVWLNRSGAHTINLSDGDSLNFTRCKFLMLTGYSAGYYNYMQRVKNSQFVDSVAGPCPIDTEFCDKLTFINTSFIGRLGTAAARGHYPIVVGGTNSNILVDGMNQCDSDGYGSSQVCYVSGSANQNIEFRNVGTIAMPYSAQGAICAVGGSFNKNIKFRRVYFVGNSTGAIAFDATGSQATMENLYRIGGVGDWINSIPGQNSKIHGFRITTPPANNPIALAYGLHWSDYFTSDTVGLLRLDFNEPSSLTNGLVTLGGGAKFNGSGYIYMPTVGDSVTVEMDYFALGHTGFANSTPLTEYGTFSKYDWVYQIDKGSGWNDTWKALTGANLSGETGISSATGIKLKVRATTNTNNTDIMSALKIATTTTLTDQRTLYPLDSKTLTITGLPAGTEVHAYLGTNPDTAVEIGGTESSGTSFSFTHTVGGSDGYITFIKRGYKFFKMPLTYKSVDEAIPVFLGADLGYNNPA